MLPIVKADGVDLDPSTASTTPAQLMEPNVADQAEAGCSCGSCGCGSEASARDEVGLGDPSQVAVTDLDVRSIAHSERHTRIFAAVAALEPGEAFVLANDHDPKPLRFQLDAREPGQIGWDYLAQGPQVWRVRISRAAAHCC
jgi:uncharacterized protein (DUF2249 family)